MLTKEKHLENILLVQENNDQAAFRRISSDYQGLIFSLAIKTKEKFSNASFEVEDLINILEYELFNSIKSFDGDKGMYFPLYVKQQLTYKASNFARSLIGKKDQITNYSSELNHEVVSADDETISDTIETLNFLKENLESFNWLTSQEKEVLRLQLLEQNHMEIAANLSISESRVYKIKKTLQSKLREKLTFII